MMNIIMKKIFKYLYIAIVILTFSIILAGCDNGSSSSAVSSNSLVKVSLTVDNAASQKSISVGSDINWASLTYQYKAEAQWQGDNIHGATVDNQGNPSWESIGYSNNSLNIGYFSPGQWVFGIRILNGQTVIYEGFSGVVSIANSSVSVPIVVNKLVTDAVAGSVRVSITAPTMQGEALGISYKLESNETITVDSNDITATSDNGRTTFESTVSDLAAGCYTFFLSHPAGGSGATVTVDLRLGEMAVISGHLDNGIWQLGYITVKVHTIDIVLYDYGNDQEHKYYGNVYKNVSSAAPGDRVSLSVEPGQDCSLDSLSLVYGDNDTPINDYTIEGDHLYTFIMPDGDVTVNARFIETGDIVPEVFMARLHSLYSSNDANVESFGRSDNPPSPSLPSSKVKVIKDLKMWFDESENKICWYSSVNNNSVKFSKGSLSGLFQKGEKYLSISLKHLDTTAVDDMSHMFDNCLYLKSVDFDGVDTSNVENMAYMFYKAGFNYFPSYASGVNGGDQTDNSENLVISNAEFNTAKVIDMSGMFHVCSATDLSGINMSVWDVSKVKDMSFMFAGTNTGKSPWKNWYTKFTGFNIQNWNTISCESFKSMFAISNRFVELNISGWKFNKVKNLDRMFERCESLGLVATQGRVGDNQKLIFPDHTYMTKAEDFLYMFGKCYEFRRENFIKIVSSWDFTGNTTIDALLLNTDNTDTTPERVLSNRIIASDQTNTSDNYRNNFGTRFKVTTKDGKTLYLGGKSGNSLPIKNCRLTTQALGYTE